MGRPFDPGRRLEESGMVDEKKTRKTYATSEELKGVEGMLRSELKGVEGVLRSELKGVESSLRSEIKSVESSLGASIQNLTIRVVRVEEGLDEVRREMATKADV